MVAGGAVSGVSEEELTAKLNDLAASMRSQLYAGFNPAPSPTYASGGILNNLAMAQNIDNLTGVTIGGATITGSTVEGYLPLQGGALSGDLALGNIVASGALTVVGAGSFGTASTTNLAISGSTTLSNIAAGTLLYNDSSKKVAAATIDPSLTFAQGALALNTANPNAFTSLQQFNGNASTTALSAGLAYFGTTATSTFTSQGWLGIATSSPSAALAVEGNGYFTGGLGIGLATTTPGALQTSGDVAVGGNLLVTGNSTVLGNSTVIGNSSAGTLAINSSINSSVVPNQNITYDLGSPSYFWRSAYIGNLSVNNISANQTTIGGTQSDTFVLNSDNVSADAEDAHLVFFRGNVVPNALLSWSSVAKRFEFNQPLFVQNASGNGGGVVTMTLKGLAGQSADLFNIASSSGAQYLAIDNAGAFTLNGAATLTSALGVAGDTTLANATSTSLNTNTLGLGNNYFTSLLGTGLTNTNGVLTVSALPNAALANSTISGIALGGSLANLSATDGTLAFSGAYNGSAAQTVGLNLGNANTWNALQQFNSGLTAFASSTIGNGTQTGGLTISGGATTTGNAYFAGNLSVGTTSQSRALTISGSTGFTDGVFSAVNNYSTGGNNSFSMTSPNMPVANETYFNLGVSNTPNNWFSEGFYYAGPGSLQNRMDLVFNSQQIPALSILASDNVGIGTTTPYSRLSVWGADTSANTTAFNVVNSASTTEFQVYDDGHAVLAGALTQNSDQRLKTNIQVLDFSSSLSAIDSLNPVSFTWVNGMFGEGSQLGFIAQDVQKSFPQLVSTTSATALTPDGTLGLNYTGLIAPIIGAVQGIAHIAGDFKSNLIAWLGSAGNGIGKLFAHEVHTNDLCVKKSDGTEVCITGDQLSALLAGQAAGASAGGGAAPSGSGSSGVGDSSTPSAGAGSSDTGGAADTGSGASSSDTSGTTSGDTTPITPAADATPATPAAPDPAASAPTTPDPTPAPVAATQ